METALTNEHLMEKLKQPEIQEALGKMVNLLPELAERLEKMERLAENAEAILEDQANKDKLKTKLDHINMDLNTLEAGLRLLEKLPFFLHLSEKLEQVFTFADDLIKDEKSMNYLLGQAEGYIGPFTEKLSLSKKVWDTAKIEPEMNRQPITVFTIIKWIKDPQVQKILFYVQGLLKEMGSEGNRKGD